MATSKAKTKSGKPRIPPLSIKNAKLVYRNFSGTAKKFNAKGLRNFHVLLEPEIAKSLEQDGWNIKWPKPRDDGEERNSTLKVRVRFDNFPPTIIMMTARGRSELDEETVSLLDTAEIENCDLKIVGSYNELETGWKGFTAYLSQLGVVLSENDIMSKYMDIKPNKKSIDEEDD